MKIFCMALTMVMLLSCVVIPSIVDAKTEAKATSSEKAKQAQHVQKQHIRMYDVITKKNVVRP